MNHSLPNDQDRELAARLLDSEREVPEGDRELVDALRAYRNDYQATPADPRAKARIWAGIERTTRLGADRAPLRKVRVMRLVWGSVAVAAAVLVLIAVPRVLTSSGQELLASAGSQNMVYTTDDGSQVTLRPHSQLFKDADAYRLEGEAFFDVTHDPSRVFRVATQGGTVEVLGTRFNVDASGSETQVYLQAGSVRFTSSEVELILEPGQSISSSAAAPVATDGDQETDWMRGELLFESRTAAAVASELARHYDLRIEIPQGRRNESLSGRILLGEESQALEDFALVLGGQFIKAGEGLRFIGN